MFLLFQALGNSSEQNLHSSHPYTDYRVEGQGESQ